MTTPAIDIGLILDVPQRYEVVACELVEGISELTHATLEIASNEDLDLSDALSSNGVVVLRAHGDEIRRWTLKVGRVGFIDAMSDTLRYKVELFAPLWLLGFTKNTRKFRKMSAEDIITKILDEHGIAHEFAIGRSTDRRNYCVQYRETNLEFVERLLEFEGIYHTLTDGGLTRFEANSPSSPTVPGRAYFADLESADALTRQDYGLHTISRGARVQSGKATVNDWSWKTPNVNLLASAEADKDGHLEIYDYPTGYRKPEQGSWLASLRLEALRVGARYLHGTGDVPGFGPARIFAFGPGAGGSFGGDYLLTRVTHEVRNPAFDKGGDGQALELIHDDAVYLNTWHAIPKDVPFRPPLQHHRPRIAGNHTVMVRGPIGQEIHTDTRGRFRAQFHWDREAVGTDEDSRWIRMLQEAGSSTWLARIGWEMNVAYIEGDPDRPVGLARDINGEMMPTYSQPASKNVMTIKTPSSPATGGYNEFKLDDSAGRMRFDVRAEKDLNVLVKNDRTETVGNNETHTVDVSFMHSVERDQTLDVGANKTDTIGGAHKTEIGGNRTVTIGGNETVKVGANANVTVTLNDTEAVGSLRLTIAGGIGVPDMLGRAQSLLPGGGSPSDAASAVGSAAATGAKDALMGGGGMGGAVAGAKAGAEGSLKAMIPTKEGALSTMTGGLSDGITPSSVINNLFVGGIDRYAQNMMLRMVGGAYITTAVGNVITSMNHGYLEAVGGAKLTVAAKGSILETVGGPLATTVGGLIMRKATGDMGFSAKSTLVNVGAIGIFKSSEKLVIESGKDLHLSADAGLTIKNGDMEIALKPGGVSIKGSVKIETEEKVEVTGATDKITDSSSDTTGNEDVVIATDGTGHVAMTEGAPDMCFLPDKKTVVGFPNSIETKGNVQNGTTNTTIGDDSILTENARIGPTSTGDEAGEGKGVVSGTNVDIAEPASWSKDVKTESEYVVRSNDRTTQNNANTSGSVVGASRAPDPAADAQWVKDRCKVTQLTGKCGHGRELGRPPGATGTGEPNYLEILGGDKVELEVVRKDDVTGGDPACAKSGEHTWWIATRTDATAGGPQAKTEEKKGVDKYVVAGDLTKHPLGSQSAWSTDGELKEHQNRPVDYRQQGGAPDTQGTDANGRPLADLGMIVKNGYNLAKAIEMWKAGQTPPTIRVTAKACSGAKNVDLKVYPHGPAEFNMFDEAIRARVAKIQKAATLVQKLADLAGQRVSVKFLESPKLTMSMEYKELTEDRPKRVYLGGLVEVDPVYKVQVNRRWQLQFAFDPLIGAEVKFCIPVATVIPWIGAAVARALKWAGLAADLCANFVLNYKPNASVAWDEYNVIDVSVTANEVEFKFSGSLEVKARVAMVTLEAGLEGAVTFTNFRPDLRRRALLGCDMNGEVQLVVRGVAKVSFLGLEEEQKVEWKPEWGKWGDKATGPGVFLPLMRI